MTQQLLPIVASTTAVVLVVFAIALCRSATRADAIAEGQEKAAQGRRRNTYDEERSSASVRRQSPQPSTNERLTTAARADTREPVRPASLAGRTGRVSVGRPPVVCAPASSDARQITPSRITPSQRDGTAPPARITGSA
jgi:hypothetical protein